jgi:hypothetical protein
MPCQAGTPVRGDLRRTDMNLHSLIVNFKNEIVLVNKRYIQKHTVNLVQQRTQTQYYVLLFLFPLPFEPIEQGMRFRQSSPSTPRRLLYDRLGEFVQGSGC